ncbi:MAG TPA: radical SAM protein [Candidatus Saccharimonadales bacterium]|nr:radical SAM protein [Candidatus Saccharimonadales bacterium]
MSETSLNHAPTEPIEPDFSELYEQGVTRIGEFNPYITDACNLRCGYCYVIPYLTTARNITEIMSTGFVTSTVDSLVANNPDGTLDRSILLGGEPTLNPYVTEIANEMAQRPIRERRMTTNATGLNYLDLDKLRPCAFDHVSVSVDGITPEVNDATRGNGTLKRILGTLALYREAGIKTSVNMTITQTSLPTMRESARFFAEQGVSIINFHCVSLTGNTFNNIDLMIAPEQWVAARDALIQDAEDNPANYAGSIVRIPYTYLTAQEINTLGYKPIQERNYHSPDGGHRLLMLPPTPLSKGLCYMSSDLIGIPGAELGTVSPTGKFTWNTDPNNELTAYRAHPTANVSTQIKHQEALEETDRLIRVSHSFKRVIDCSMT